MGLFRLLRGLSRLLNAKIPPSHSETPKDFAASSPSEAKPSWHGQRPKDFPASPPLATKPLQVETVMRGRCWVIDGDTIVIDKTHIRLAGIDAPELDHPWGQSSKGAMIRLTKGQVVTARIKPELSYDRVVAECSLSDGRDLAAELVRCGLALDWAKFSGGKYRHLEPADARRKLWRADARQKGKLSPPGNAR